MRSERGRTLSAQTVAGRRVLRADLRSSFSGIVNNPVRVTLRFEPFAGGAATTSEMMISLDDDGLGDSLAQNVEVEAPAPGRYWFSASAASVRTNAGQFTISHLRSDVTVADTR